MLTYRIQICGKEWILRHPDQTLPLLQCKEKEDVIKLLPDYFKKRKVQAIVNVLNDTGQFEQRLEF